MSPYGVPRTHSYESVTGAGSRLTRACCLRGRSRGASRAIYSALGAARLSPHAPAAEAQGVRWKPDLFILHNRKWWGPPPSAKFPAPGAGRCPGSRRQRPARDTVRAAAELRATGRWAPGGRGGPAGGGEPHDWDAGGAHLLAGQEARAAGIPIVE